MSFEFIDSVKNWSVVYMKDVKNAVGRAVIQKLIVVHISITEPFLVSLFSVFLREEKFMLYSLLIFCYSLCI